MHRNLSALWALLAVILWASLAMTSQLLTPLPAFFQLAVAFAIGGSPLLCYGRRAFPRARTLLLGVVGFYGYHFFLLTSFRLAPPVAANLINYLWPMLMVLLTPIFFPMARLTAGHYAGAALALLGVLILMLTGEMSFSSQNLLGFGLAALAAVTWPVYSLLKKKTPDEKVITTAGVCAVTALLCLITHLTMESYVVPTPAQWGWLVWLGVGPFGAAFFLWDVAVKRGDPRVVGALSYLTPVLSTLLLVFGAGAQAHDGTWAAMVLMSLGSTLGAWASRTT